MSDDTNDALEPIRKRIIEAIARSDRGKWSIKIKTLMAEFGFNAVQRVRRSSFLAIIDLLNEWGIECRYNGNSANDYITLRREDNIPVPSNTSSNNNSALSVDTFRSCSPFSLLFQIGDTLEDARSQLLSVDVLNAAWSFRPICLLVEASDEYFSFVCGFFAAIMRRRALMVRQGVMTEASAIAPEIITTDQLKRFLGESTESLSLTTFPIPGAVYIMRNNPEDYEDEEMIATVRECFVPHTYRIKAKYATTSGDPSQGDRAVDATGFDQIIEWMLGFTGTLKLSQSPVRHQIDLASLLAEVAQTRDHLLERHALRPTDKAFRAGYESTEHMVLKSALLNGLRRIYPGEKIAVEELIDPRKDEAFADQDTVDYSRRDKPDIKVGNAIWVEVETMRALSLRGSNPFFMLEAKIRQKLNNMKAVKEVWLLVPSDIALLATEQLGALARNLNAVLGENKLRCGFVDVIKETPVFLEYDASSRPTEVRLSGVSWRTRKITLAEPLTFDDIAGYSGLKQRLKEDLLDPLLEPDKYSKHGIFAANGLLLYGLPGCGKSLTGRVLGSMGGLDCRLIMPSDITSMWVGEGVMKIRALFDWALKQSPCLLVLDEIDAIAPQRTEDKMHADEKRQVNELLAQLDRISGKGVVIVATTNYLRGIDPAIQRSGRFDVKMPVFPPDVADRSKIYEYYLTPPHLKAFDKIQEIDTTLLAAESILFTPADIKNVVHTAARKAIREASVYGPALSTEKIITVIKQHPRSIRRDMAIVWIEETAEEIGQQDKQLLWLKDEVERAYGALNLDTI